VKEMPMARRLFAVSALAVAAVLVAACGEGEASPSNSTPPPNSEPQEIRVLMHDNYFEPTEITVPPECRSPSSPRTSASPCTT
jgi:hypothetical protein